MAKLVTSDGVQINLFLDLNSHNIGNGTSLYGPKSQAEMDFIVKGFRNFRTNTEYNDKNRLECHCEHVISINISTLMSGTRTQSNPYVVDANTKLYFVGDDLVLSKTGSKIHRIDLFTSASSNDVLTVNGTSPDASGNVTVTVGNDHSTEITNLDNRVTTLENTGGGGNNALYAPPQTLFLDTDEIDQAQHGGNQWIYGPLNNETYPSNPTVYLNFNVPQFENFFVNHSDKYKLAIYSGDIYTEVIISDLVSFFDPTNNTSSTKKYYIHYDDTSTRDNELWFEFKNSDLILYAFTPSTSIATMWRIYRIDMHLNAFGGGVTTVNGQTGDVTVSTGSSFDGNYNSLSNKPSLFDGNYNSLSNKPSVYTTSQTYSKSEVDSLTSSSGGGGGLTNQKVFTTSGSWTVPAGVDKVKISVTGGGGAGSSNHATGGGAGGTAIAIFDVSQGETLTLTVAAPGGHSKVSISGRTGEIQGNSGYMAQSGGSSNTISTGLNGDALLISGGVAAYHPTYPTTGGSSIYGSTGAYGGGAMGVSNNLSAGSNGVVVVEY